MCAYMNDVARHETTETSNLKDNRVSALCVAAVTTIGQSLSMGKALKRINKSLCFAEIDSDEEGISYRLRSWFFKQCKQYALSVVVIELAKKNKHSVGVIDVLNHTKEECLKATEAAADDEAQPLVEEPMLSFPSSAKVPCFAQGLEMKQSDEFGKHIVTTRNLEIGQTVIVEEALSITPTNNENYSHCANCFAREGNLIPCKKCSAVMFCSPNCHDIGNEKFHAHECRKPGVDTEWEAPRRLVLQMVIRAIETFPTMKELMDTVEKTINRNPNSEENLNDAYAETPIRACMQIFELRRNNKLTTVDEDFQSTFLAKIIHSQITSDPAYQYLFRSVTASRFLAHFILHHVFILGTNGVEVMSFSHGMFETILGAGYGCDFENRSGFTYAHGIYPNSSRLNHSCQPNIARIFIGKNWSQKSFDR